jgi:hypothetical protein
MRAYLVTPVIGLTLFATVTTACSMTNGTVATTGGTSEGSASPKAAKEAREAKQAKEDNSRLPKGELMGTGVGAAAGAVYDVKKRKQ